MIVGFVCIARAGLAALVRWAGSLLVGFVDVLALVADLIDPDMPESIRRPREWLPRLWARLGARAPSEDRD